MASPTDPLELRLIRPDEIEAAYALIQECAQENRDLYQISPWLTYPPESFRASTQQTEVYVVYLGRALLATFTASTRSERYGNLPLWEDGKAKALYLSKFAVRKSLRFGGRSFRLCFSLVEAVARSKGCNVCRFQAVAAHERTVKLYGTLANTRGPARLLLDGSSEPTDMILFELYKPVLRHRREKSKAGAVAV